MTDQAARPATIPGHTDDKDAHLAPDDPAHLDEMPSEASSAIARLVRS